MQWVHAMGACNAGMPRACTWGAHACLQPVSSTRLLRCRCSCARRFDAAACARLIWGLASCRVHPGDAWLLAFCKASQAKLLLCSPPQLAILVYGLARLAYRPPDVWIAAWLEVALPALPGFSAQNLANAAWGLACWR